MSNLLEYLREVKANRSSSAYYKLVQLFEARVFTLCYRIIGSREEAQEAAQDVFLQCFQKIDSLEDEEKFSQWILKMAYNRSIDYVRKKKVKYVALESDNVHSYLSIEMPEQETGGQLKKYLSICDELEKTIITLYYQEEMSTQEIADVLDLSKANIKIKLFRARNKIKKFIENKDLLK